MRLILLCVLCVLCGFPAPSSAAWPVATNTANRARNAAEAQYTRDLAALATNADYAVYTNLPALLDTATKWQDVRGILKRHHDIEQKLKAAKDNKDKKDKEAKSLKGGSK